MVPTITAEELLAAFGVLVLFGQLDGGAEGLAARDDGDLVERLGAFGEGEDDGVAGLVAGGHPLFLVVEDARAALAAPADLVAGFFEILFVDGLGAAAGGEQGALVHEVGEVGAGEAGGAAGDVAQLDGGVELDLARVDLEDGFAAFEVGQVHDDLAVEAAGPQQGGRGRRAGWWRR